MPLPKKKYNYISADNHLNTPWLPKNIWQDRLPAKLKEIGPKVVETNKGSFWSWEGKLRKVSAEGSSWQKLVREEFGEVSLPPAALPPSDPVLVGAHMDMAAVYAAIFYGDTRKWKVENPTLMIEMYRAYNDFCLELSEYDPNRWRYLPNLPTADPGATLTELRRVANLGVKAIEFSVFDVGAPLSSSIWEPFWEEAADRGIVVCSHTGHGAGAPRPPNEGGASLAAHAVSPFVAARPIADMVFSGVFEKHPHLKWVMAECRIGWLPFLFSWMDRQYRIREPDQTINLTMPPSNYVLRNISFTFEDDWVGAMLLPNDWSLLAETAMWACDYPHPQNVWPDPAPVVRRMLGDLDKATRNEILYGRAAKLFEIDFIGA